MKYQRSLVCCLSLCWALGTHGYEVDTHAAITQHIYTQSALQKSGLLSVLGIENNESPFGDLNIYYDISGAGVHSRDTSDPKNKSYELAKIGRIKEGPQNDIPVNPFSIKGWMMQGAIREDDIKSGPCKEVPDNRLDDPHPENRPINHFYNPVNDRGLNAIIIGAKAMDWGLGVQDAFAQPPVVDTARDNHYTLADAREAMYRALTGRMNGVPVEDENKIGPDKAVNTKAIRDAYWATTFRALGDVLHLVEDMAQPQHTRNDSHLDECEQAPFLVNKSVYEDWINHRTLRSEYVTPGPQYVPAPPLKFDGYDIPRFNDAVSYFSTRNKQGNIMDRQGMADYSNRGFFTTGTNWDISSADSYPHNTYPYPESDYPAYDEVTLSKDWTGGPLQDNGQVTMLAGTVHDSLPNGHVAHDVPLTTLGVFDEFLEHDNHVKRYTLNRYNYDAMADLLIPRAVAYGAGLIDYFFRGRLAISLPPEGIYGVIDQATPHAVVNDVPRKGQAGDGGVFGFEKIILNVSNITPPIDDGQVPYAQNIGTGTFRAVAHYRYNPCYTLDLSGETSTACDTNLIEAQPMTISTSKSVSVTSFDNNNTNRLEFDFSDEPIPINAADLRIQVVFRGQLGSETDAIAVGMQDISEPTYLLVRNTTDYFSFYGVVYRYNDPELWDLIDPDHDGNPNYPIYPLEYSSGAGAIKLANAAGVIQTAPLDAEHYVHLVYLSNNSPIDYDTSIPPFTGGAKTAYPRVVQKGSSGYDYFSFSYLGQDPGNKLYKRNALLMVPEEYPVGWNGDWAYLPDFPAPPARPDSVTIDAPFNGSTP